MDTGKRPLTARTPIRAGYVWVKPLPRAVAKPMSVVTR